MTLIDRIDVPSQSGDRFVGLYTGDLTAIPANEAVDLLVVSAFPNDYLPTTTSLIGALARSGVSVAALASRKAVDLRRFSCSWLSEDIAQPHIGYKRIMCFEPLIRGSAPEVVGDVFRSLVPFTTGTPPISSVAMPILATGDQGNSPSVMLEAIVEAAVHWMSIGLDLKCIKIVIRESANSATVASNFAKMKARSSPARTAKGGADSYRFDAFVSYARKDQDLVDYLITEISRAQPSFRFFIDRLDLQAGSAWQQHIFEALDDCHKVVPLFSPSYVASKVCKEEFNIALMRHRDSEEGVLLPLYVFSAELPTYMRMLQCVDVREGDKVKLCRAVKAILESAAREPGRAARRVE